MDIKRIEVVALRPMDRGNLKAFVSVRLGGVTIHDCRIVQQSGQRAWVSMPQREYADAEGQKKYSAVVELSDALKKVVADLILHTWEHGDIGKDDEDDGF